ncbi:MAG: hypothetical protein HUK17_00625 [Bacteroidales bacterium]|nr:hypothetical protein [Bacteroidales bacterium]
MAIKIVKKVRKEPFSRSFQGAAKSPLSGADKQKGISNFRLGSDNWDNLDNLFLIKNIGVMALCAINIWTIKDTCPQRHWGALSKMCWHGVARP